jgi:phosphohistidine phosphatase SixA
MPRSAPSRNYISHGSDEILSVIHKINEKLNSVLIISHNPGLQAFALKFSKAGDKQKYREMKAILRRAHSPRLM